MIINCRLPAEVQAQNKLCMGPHLIEHRTFQRSLCRLYGIPKFTWCFHVRRSKCIPSGCPNRLWACAVADQHVIKLVRTPTLRNMDLYPPRIRQEINILVQERAHLPPLRHFPAGLSLPGSHTRPICRDTGHYQGLQQPLPLLRQADSFL